MSHSNPLYAAVIFDMDGLVLDTESTYCIAWQRAATKMGMTFTEQFCLSMSGLHYQDVEARLLDFCGAGFDLKKFSQLSGEYWHEYVDLYGIPVKKGFFNLISRLELNNIPFCLATNSRRLNVLECLKLAKIDNVFSEIVTRDDVTEGKPAADVFILAAKILNQPVEHCLVLEDSITGIQAAVGADTRSVFIPSVFPVDEVAVKLADYYRNDLDEVISLMGL